MTVDGDLLRAFEAVARIRSVGKAAQILNTTQPTLSRHIRILEQNMGIALFDRTPHGMALTIAGEELLPRARLILHEMELAVSALGEMQGLVRGVLRVGGGAGIVRGVLPDVLAAVANTAPNLRIEILEASEDRLDLALAHREVDIVFTTNPPQEVAAVPIGTRIFEDRCVVFCRQGHVLTKTPMPETASLLEFSWTMPHPGASTRLRFEHMLHALGHGMPQITFQTDNVDCMIAHVSRTAVLGWLPRPLLDARSLVGDIALLDVPDLEWLRIFRPYRRATGSLHPCARILIDALEQSI